MADPCHHCDRLDCQRERASRAYWRATSVITSPGQKVDGHTLDELARASALAHADCDDHRVNWRARALAAEARLAAEKEGRRDG